MLEKVVSLVKTEKKKRDLLLFYLGYDRNTFSFGSKIALIIMSNYKIDFTNSGNKWQKCSLPLNSYQQH